MGANNSPPPQGLTLAGTTFRAILACYQFPQVGSAKQSTRLVCSSADRRNERNNPRRQACEMAHCIARASVAPNGSIS